MHLARLKVSIQTTTLQRKEIWAEAMQDRGMVMRLVEEVVAFAI